MKSKAMWSIGTLAVLALGYVLFVESFGEPGFVREAHAKDAVRHQLFDGKSAEFRNVHATNSITVCGEVNAKNRFGAYVGFAPFSVTGNDDKPIVAIDDEFSNTLCK